MVSWTIFMCVLALNTWSTCRQFCGAQKWWIKWNFRWNFPAHTSETTWDWKGIYRRSNVRELIWRLPANCLKSLFQNATKTYRVDILQIQNVITPDVTALCGPVGWDSLHFANDMLYCRSSSAFHITGKPFQPYKWLDRIQSLFYPGCALTYPNPKALQLKRTNTYWWRNDLIVIVNKFSGWMLKICALDKDVTSLL